ncbi:alpha-ketoglutarate-dependent dioxygenase AlkB family protein [Halpernia frigidisoli]|uniref:Alkylated DNA repair dioxygenase AlkB n=1 Tax=Halpernia frigidisoli TaxID=1125876 RepID=A0A1I3HHR6_9FLAO|nr:alpha-ketoglutarate-dependent dioxygenase AlkB [Halpernia frigidisoli]SFI35222.1 Alkylated DNA repair dioxygenase AlkB [Halpernia frigidisoli]
MELFPPEFTSEKNYLPYDGTVNYYGKVVAEIDAEKFYFNLLNDIEWKNDEAVIFGKLIYTKRKVAWYAEDAFEYTYSNRTKKALKFTEDLLKLKKLVEEKTGETFNSCLLNLYHSGEEGMAYHSDGEKDLKMNGAIASLSFGAERKFSFKHKTTKERVDFQLQPGSLLVMKGETQKNWLHRLPPTKKVFTPRINLTFRTIEI